MAINTSLSESQNAAELDYEDEQPKKPSQNEQRRDVQVFVDVHKHPKTGFSCVDKQPGQYYADPETKCAVYYVCIPNAQGSLSAQSFACPNGTIFNQATRVCSPHDQVYCRLAERYYENVHGNIDSKGLENVYDKDVSNNWSRGRGANRNSTRQQSANQPAAFQPANQPAASQPVNLPARRTPIIIPTQKPTRELAVQPPDYEYEYVDYPDNGTNASSASRTRRSAPPKHKGRYQTYPFDFLSQPHILTNFTCQDKVPGIAYADVEVDCRMFHVCIPIAKGKLKDYQLHCDAEKKFNQETASCELQEKVNCSKSEKFFVYNKWFRPEKTKKESWRLFKKMHGRKSKQ